MINRIEKKFILKKELLNEFINFIEIKKKMKKKFIDRKINSIYFDDENNKFVLENLNGFAQRMKIRFRWYNQNNKNITEEIKLKKGNKSQKISRRFISPKSILQILNEGNIEQFVDKKLKCNKKYLPNCLITYYRSYYISDFCRLTIDNNLKYFNIKNNNLDYKSINDNSVIIEVKINENDFKNFFRSNFDLSPLVNVRMSKYMRARSLFMNFEYF